VNPAGVAAAPRTSTAESAARVSGDGLVTLESATAAGTVADEVADENLRRPPVGDTHVSGSGSDAGLFQRRLGRLPVAGAVARPGPGPI
jgi:hypothetical protein